MSGTNQTVRMAMGCGYEPPAGDRVHLTIWQPPLGKNGYSGPALTACAGYTVNLPEVTEAMVARAHWSKGNASVLGPLTQAMLDAILIVEGQCNQMQAWAVTPVADGGGGQ